MATSALLAALSHFERCDHDLSESVRKTLLAPLEGDRLTKKDLEVYQKRLTPLAMSIINQNLASFSKLHDHAGNSKTAQDSEMIACLIDTSFYALRALHLLNDTKAVKHLDVEKARSNLITKLININQVISQPLFQLHFDSPDISSFQQPVQPSHPGTNVVPRTLGQLDWSQSYVSPDTSGWRKGTGSRRKEYSDRGIKFANYTSFTSSFQINGSPTHC